MPSALPLNFRCSEDGFAEMTTERSFAQKLVGLSSIDGMTLRDWFAGQAMAALIAERPVNEKMVAEAYQCADAMLAERQKP